MSFFFCLQIWYGFICLVNAEEERGEGGSGPSSARPGSNMWVQSVVHKLLGKVCQSWVAAA